MSHTFDTGQNDPQRTILQQGAIALLSKLTKAHGGYLSSVFAFGGVVRTYSDEVDIELLMRVFGKTPAIGVATGTRRFDAINVQRTDFKSECELILYIATQHGRDMQRGRMESDTKARADLTADPGLHVVMAHTLELMCGAFPASTPDIKQLIPVVEEELAPLAEITIWRQMYQVQLSTLKIAGRGGREFRTPEQLLTSVGWRVTTNPAEPDRPASAVSSTTIDADSET